MKGDFTRETFKPERHYQRVLMQQGRVQVDADWNEQAAIAARRDETTTADITGHCGGPAGNAAFAISTTAPAGQPAPGAGDFYLSAGRYYVDGIQCELEKPTLFTQQPDRFGLVGLANNNSYLVYLDVWRRHLTFHEQNDIRESALTGPDTGTRVKTVWQVRAAPLNSPINPNMLPADPCREAANEFDLKNRPALPKLSARAQPATSEDDPCIVPATAGYRGLENQLYRVEIHDPGALDVATFKWSRENGSVATRITKNATVALNGANTNLLTVASTGLDENLGFAEDDLVEIIHQDEELESIPGALALVAKVDISRGEITLKQLGANPMPIPLDLSLNPRLRRWEDSAVAAFDLTVNDGFLSLENGVEVLFELPAGAEFRTGDYWQIPARAASPDAQSGDIEWPISGGVPQALPPQGIQHHVCRLGVVNVSSTGVVTIVSDCRCLWPELTAVPRLFYVSGDGQEVMPEPTLVPTVSGRFRLPKALIVGVNNGPCQSPGTQVRFTVLSPSTGFVTTLGGTPTQGTVDVPLDAEGLAKCDFYLDGVNVVQQVRARLLDASGQESSLPIIFNANLSIASQVGYRPPDECAGLSGVVTVGQALDRLRDQVSLYAESPTHVWLTTGQNQVSLTVLAANRCGPVAGVPVQYGVSPTGSATVSPTSISTQADGKATTLCQLSSQAQNAIVVASIPGASPSAQPKQVFFAIERTSQAVDEPGIKVTGLFWQNADGGTAPLLNDVLVPARFLAGGIGIQLDSDLIPLGVANKPTCYVTLDLPFPFRGLHGEVWGFDLLGYETIRLDATTNSDNRIIVWNPTNAVAAWLRSTLSNRMTWNEVGNRLLARLTLKGNFIWVGATPQTYLDGNSFGAVDDSNPTEIIFPSGDGRRGGDFEMWFWLGRNDPIIKITDKFTDKALDKDKDVEVKLTDKALEGVVVPAAEGKKPIGKRSPRRSRKTSKSSGEAFIPPEERPPTTPR